MTQPVPIYNTAETTAHRATRLHIQAQAAAHNLTLEWLAAARTAAALASAVATCQAASPGVRDLARRQTITLAHEADTATAILQR